MADVAAPVGILTQIRLVAGLRWRILRNGLRKKNNRLDLIGMIFVGILSALFVFGLCFAFFAGGYNFLSEGRYGWLSLLFWAIFIFWQLFPIFAAGFGAGFEFRTLLRFPLNLTSFYIISLAYGLADFSALASVCWLASMTLGAATAKPAVLPAMLLVATLFLLLNVTLERLVGSWLERLLSRRRTRELFFALFILSMVSLNLIEPIMRRYGATLRPLAQRIVPYFSWLPPSLAGKAIASAAQAHLGGVVLGFAGLLLYAAVFSGFLWARFAKQYRGEELSETAAPTPVAARAAAKVDDAPDHLSALSPQVAAIVRKEFRYLTRNSFSFFSLIVPPMMILIFSAQLGGARPRGTEFHVSSEMLFPGIMAYLVLILMAPAYNCFAFEGRGIQAYFMAPLRFREVFLGKNLMLLSVLAVEMALSLAMLAWRLGLPSPPVFVATLTAIVFAVVGQLSLANWSSLNFPRKLEFGQMRGQRQSGMAVLIAFGAQFVFGGVSAVILFGGRLMGNRWLPAEAFALLAAAAVGGYFASLDALSRIAEKKKEVLIEALCR
jgi:ABC-2 type transport system permease protein